MKCQAMEVEMRRQKVFEECRLRYSKVLGKEWGDEAKRKAEADKAKRELGTKSADILPGIFQSQLRSGSPRSRSRTSSGSVQLERNAEIEVTGAPVLW